MIVEDVNTIAFSELSNGDLFRYEGEYYIKCFLRESRYNTVDVRTGELCYFGIETDVDLLHGSKITVM